MDRLLSLCLAGAAPALPQDWWLRWSFAPVPLLAIGLLAVAAARGTPPQRRLAWAGCGLCVLAWVSPLCRLGATLAAGHMAQLMVGVAAGALLAAGWPARAGRSVVRAPMLPLPTAVHAVVLWGWHVPAVYTAILADPLVHVGAWGLLLASSFAFWRAVLHAGQARALAGLLALLVTLVHTGLLGALLTFASQPLYGVQAAGARAWGLEPLADQQLAGLLMWVPGGFAYLAAAAVLGVRLLARASGGSHGAAAA